MSEQTYKINVSVKFKSTKGVRRFVIRADNFQGLHDAFTTEMKKVVPNATAVYWTDADGDKVYMESVSELEEAYHLSAAPNNNLLNLIVDEETKKDLETTSTTSSSSAEPDAKDTTTMSLAQDFTGCLHNAICDLCDCPIVGHRFRCLMCNDYDLCGPCESTGAHSEHAMLRIVDPNLTRIPWGAKLSQDYQRLYQGLDEQLRQTQPYNNEQFNNFKKQGMNMLAEVGNVLQNTLANFGIEASYEVRNPKEKKKEEKKDEPAAEQPLAAETVPTAPAPEVAPNAPPQEVPTMATEKTKIQVVKKVPSPVAAASTVLNKTTEAKQVAFVPAPVVKKVKPEPDFEKMIQGVNAAGAHVAAHGPALPTQMSAHEKSRRAAEAKKAAQLKQTQEAKPVTEADNKMPAKVATGIFATANRRVAPPPPPFPVKIHPIPAGLFKTAQPVPAGLFATQKTSSPRGNRDREHERRRDNYHRLERYDYHSDESAGRSPSPPRFGGTRGSFDRKTEPTVQNANSFEYFKAKMARAHEERKRQEAIERKEAQKISCAKMVEKRQTEAKNNGFGSSSFGNCNLRPVYGGFGSTNGFEQQGFGERSFSGNGGNGFTQNGFASDRTSTGFGGGFGGRSAPGFGQDYSPSRFGCGTNNGFENGFAVNGFTGQGFGTSSDRGFGFGRPRGFGEDYHPPAFQRETDFGKDFPSHEKCEKVVGATVHMTPINPRQPSDDEDWGEEVTPVVYKKSAFKNVTETSKKPEVIKQVKKMTPKEAVEIINAARAESKKHATTVIPTIVKAETSASLTNFDVELEKKEAMKFIDAHIEKIKTSQQSNATVAVPEAATADPAPAMAMVPFVEKEETATKTVEPTPVVAPEAAPETTDTQSIGSEVEHIEDVDSDGWVDAKEVSDAVNASLLDGSLSTSTSTTATVPTPRENVYPTLMQEEVSIGGQAREDTFAKLLTMGFSDIEARRAIAHCGCDVWNCVEYINMQQ